MPSTNVKGTGDFSDLNKNIQNTAKMVADLGLKLSGISAAGKAFDMVTGAIGGTVNALGKIGLAAQGIEAIGKSAVSMGMSLVQGNAALEMTTISFQTLLGSASAAQDMIKQLTAFAQSTPFELQGLEANTQRLLAFGFSAKDIIPLMTSLGDAISALGGTQDNLNSLVYVMGQMRQEAHINAGDIMQMVNLGIPALQMLADHYHVTTGQIQEMISKGLIPGQDAVKIFTDSLEKQYGGMMAAQSQTFNGMISNLQDWASATMITLTKPLFAPAKKGLQALLDYVQSPAGVAAVNKLAGYIQLGVDKMTKAFIAFEPHIRPVLQHVLQIAQALRSQFTPGIITLLPHLTELWQRLEPIALGVFKFYENVKPLSIALNALQGYIKGGVTGALDALRTRFAMLSGYLQIGLNAVLGVARKWGPTILSWVANTAIAIARQALAWGEALITWVAPYAARLVGELINLAGQVLNWAIRYAPILGRQIISWADAIVGWVMPAIPRILNVLLQFGFEVLSWLEREIPQLVNMLLVWTDTLTGWILPAIPGIIRALEQVGAAILNWGVTRLPKIIGQIVVGVGQAFGLNLSPAVNDILLVFNSLVTNIESVVLPAFMQMMGFLSGTAQPIFDRMASFIATTVIPTIASLAAFTMTVLVPAFVTAGSILGTIFGPALTLIGSIIRNELLPSLEDSWGVFNTKYLPTVQTLAQKIGQDLAGGVQFLVDKFKIALPVLEGLYQKLKPIVGPIWDIYTAVSPLSIAIDTLNGFLNGGIQGGLDAFGGHLDRIGQLAKDLIPKILDGLTSAIPQVLQWITDQAPKIFEQLGKWGESFGKLVDKVMPPLLAALGKIINGIFDWITENGPSILDKLGEWAGKFGDWAKGAIPIMLTKLGELINSLLKWLGDHAPEILGALGEWAGKFVEWAAGLIAQIYPKLGEFAQKLWTWIGEQAPGLADKLMEWVGAFVGWIVTQAIPQLIQLLPKMWFAIMRFIAEIEINIAKTIGSWVGAFLGWVGDVVRQLPGKLWDIIVGIGSWIGSMAGKIAQVAGDIGGSIINGIITAIHDAPGKIWDAVTGVLGNGAVNIIKGVVQAVANFFVDVVNTPINLLNTIVDTLHGIDIFGAKPFEWIPKIPKLGYLQFASGTMNAPGGLSLVGERGMELINFGQNQLMLATKAMLLDLPRGAQVYNNQQTKAMLPNPASAQQISNMYQTSYANRSWDYSTNQQNSNNQTQNYYINGQPVGQWSFGQMARWQTAR